jgi:hypothetical protein
MIAHTPYVAYLEDGKLLLAQLSHPGFSAISVALVGREYTMSCAYRAGEAPFKSAIDKDI